MQKIVYAMHLPESHKLIAEQIEREKPQIYLSETPEVLDPDHDSYLSDPNVTIEDLQSKISQKGWRIDIREKGLEKILEVLKRNKIRRVGVESEEALFNFSKFQHAEIIPLLYSLSLDKTQYVAGQKHKGKKGFFGVDLDIFFEDPVSLRAKIDENLKKLGEKFKIFIQKEIERDKYIVKRIKELAHPDMFAYFGLSHRTISNLLEREGLKIPFEIVGDYALDPEEKLSLLLKYEELGLDPSELRNSDVVKDCDPSKKELYLDLAPDYFGFEDLNKKGFDHITLVNYFWRNLERITGKS